MRTVVRRAALVAYCGLIFYLSSRNDYPSELVWYPGWLPESHLVAHFFLYAGLGLVAVICFRSEKALWLKSNSVAMAVIFCAMYGLSDEIHQHFVPGRIMEFKDLIADTAGAAFAVMASGIIKLKRDRNK
ncbi:MAG TPA: VanZ family protein [bacterium]|nr:VanZ family protein [bacterium]